MPRKRSLWHVLFDKWIHHAIKDQSILQLGDGEGLSKGQRLYCHFQLFLLERVQLWNYSCCRGILSEIYCLKKARTHGSEFIHRCANFQSTSIFLITSFTIKSDVGYIVIHIAPNQCESEGLHYSLNNFIKLHRDFVFVIQFHKGG